MSESLTAQRDFVAATSGQVSWQQAMKSAVRSARELAEKLQLDQRFTKLPHSEEGEADFPVFVPLEFLQRIRPGDPQDPLLLQVWPAAEEADKAAGFTIDPVGELGLKQLHFANDRILSSAPTAIARNEGRLIQKYAGRCLLIAHQACGIHCRYCFRRHYPYQEATRFDPLMQQALAEIKADPSLEEVILSGGDPLVLTDSVLGDLVEQISSIKHVKRLRIHSRMPIVIPQRVTQALVEILSSSRLAVWFIVHCNHANELDQATQNALERLVNSGIPVLNQAVLLARINDSVEALESLCSQLINIRVQPYYLHQLDRVLGAAHFEVPFQSGLLLIDELRKRLPGYAIPTYVREEAGAASKTVIQAK